MKSLATNRVWHNLSGTFKHTKGVVCWNIDQMYHYPWSHTTHQKRHKLIVVDSVSFLSIRSLFSLSFIITLTSCLLKEKRVRKPYAQSIFHWLNSLPFVKVRKDKHDACLLVISVETECFIGPLCFYSRTIRRSKNPRRTHTAFDVRVSFFFFA